MTRVSKDRNHLLLFVNDQFIRCSAKKKTRLHSQCNNSPICFFLKRLLRMVMDLC